MLSRLRNRSGSGSSRRLAWGTLDQGLSSGSNFLLVFSLARASTPTQLGLLLIGYAVVTLAIGVCRNGFGAILGMDLPLASHHERRVLVGRSAAAVCVAAVPASLALVVYAWSVKVSQDGFWALVVLACALPVLLLQDLQRFWAVARGFPAHAAAADGLWFAVAGVGLTVSVMQADHPSATVGVAIWASGGVLSGALFAGLGYRVTPLVRGLRRWLSSDVRRAKLVGDSLLGYLAPLTNASLIAALGTPLITATVRGSSTLFGPLNLLSATISLVLVPEAKRLGMSRARRLFTLTALGFAVAAVGWATVLYVLPTQVGEALLGPSWHLVRNVVLIMAIEYVGLGFSSVARATLQAQGRLGAVLSLRVGYSLAVVLLPAVAVVIWPTAAAVTATLAFCSLALAAAALVATRRAPAGSAPFEFSR